MIWEASKDDGRLYKNEIILAIVHKHFTCNALRKIDLFKKIPVRNETNIS